MHHIYSRKDILVLVWDTNQDEEVNIETADGEQFSFRKGAFSSIFWKLYCMTGFSFLFFFLTKIAPSLKYKNRTFEKEFWSKVDGRNFYIFGQLVDDSNGVRYRYELTMEWRGVELVCTGHAVGDENGLACGAPYAKLRTKDDIVRHGPFSICRL